MDINQFNKRKENLEVIEAFTRFTLYYDRHDKSLWVWNGSEFYGIDTEDLYKQLIEHMRNELSNGDLDERDEDLYGVDLTKPIVKGLVI